jgi:serine/threonine-protein kinase RsbW
MYEGPKREPIPSGVSTSVTLPRIERSVTHARTALRAQLATWRVPSDYAATAELLLSELVTNAVRHAGSYPSQQVGVRFALADGLIRLEVSDSCTTAPQLRAVTPDAESGRGIHLVSALADNWGVTRRPCGAGKTVWAELKIPPDVSGSPANEQGAP